MRANLDSTKGYPLSEGVMLALARQIGKQTAYKIVHDLVSSARPRGQSFREAVMGAAKIRAHLNADELERLLDPSAQIGQCQKLVDRVLAAVQRDIET
jgi:adenylosuccinate lyase